MTGEARQQPRERLRLALLLLVCAVVIGTDQAAKWYAWRNLDGALINSGGYILLGPARFWFASAVVGAVANGIGLLLVAAGFVALVRHRRSLLVTVGGGLVAAGWFSNLLDRVGLHEWSAPGSGRGVVDFIPSGGTSKGNVADVWIVLGVLLLGYALARRRSGAGRTARRTGIPMRGGRQAS
jgi:lipoprotein signal peptidase